MISNYNLNKLSNKIPTFLLYQHSLRVLDLSNNMLKGQFPGWLLGNNMSQEHVTLNDNSFSGHVHFPLSLNFTYWMDMSNNELTRKQLVLTSFLLPFAFQPNPFPNYFFFYFSLIFFHLFQNHPNQTYH